MQCVFSSLFRPITKLMWIPACNETNLQADTQWKGKGIRETTLLINGFKLKTTNSSSCRPAVCFNDCGMGPDVGLSSFSDCPTFSVNSLWIIGVCYRGILVSVGQSHDISLWSILSLGNRSINVETSNGSWRQGIKGEMTCTVYVALVWNIIYWIMMIITLFTE